MTLLPDIGWNPWEAPEFPLDQASPPPFWTVPDIRITVFGEVVPKGRGRVGILPTGQATVYTPKATRDYENKVRAVARRVMGEALILEGPLMTITTIWLSPPTSWSLKRRSLALAGKILPTKRPDLDNYLKAALDALGPRGKRARRQAEAGICFRDDAQVVSEHTHKRYGPVPALVIDINEIPDVESAP